MSRCKGSIKSAETETLFELEAIRRGYYIGIPKEARHYDRFIEKNEKVLRVQIKGAAAPGREGSYKFSLDRHRKAKYSSKFGEVFAFYAADIKQWWLIPWAEVNHLKAITLTMNNSKYEKWRNNWKWLKE